MENLISHLQEKLVISTEQAGIMHAAFDMQHEVKEFALTLYYYSPKAYKYVRSIIPLPNPSLLRKWSSSVSCEPGFFKEAFTGLASEVSHDAIKKDCCLISDAMAIRKQTIWDPQKDQ